MADGVMIRDGFQESPLFEALKELSVSVRVISGTADSCVDLWLGNADGTVVQFIDFKELNKENDFTVHKAHIKQLAKDFPRAVVVAVSDQATSGMIHKSFYVMQELIVIEEGLVLIHVQDWNEAAKYIQNLMECASSKQSSCNSVNSASSVHPKILQAVQCLPQTGKVKSLKLLQNFESIAGIANASKEELEAVVGANNAKSIYSFFHEPIV